MKYESWLFGKDGALFRAASTGKLALVEELIGDGANVNAASRNGYTPLHRAAQNGHEKVVALLCRHGANPRAASNDQVTPLALAEKNGHGDTMRRLLQRDT